MGLHLTAGQAHDLEGADVLLDEVHTQAIIADKAYDADEWRIRKLSMKGIQAVILSRRCRKQPCEFDRHLYKARHLIENFFCRLKQFRSIATRYDKTARNFLAGIQLACSYFWLG